MKLQQKYGNVKEQVHVAPPPVANIVSTPSQKVNQVQSNPTHQGTCNQLPIPSKLAVFPPRVPGISTSLNNSPKSLDENISKTETKDESSVSQSQSPSHHTRSSTAQILNSHHDSMPPTNPTTDARISQVGATRPSTHPDDSCASKPVTGSNKTFSSSTSTLIRPGNCYMCDIILYLLLCLLIVNMLLFNRWIRVFSDRCKIATKIRKC